MEKFIYSSPSVVTLNRCWCNREETGGNCTSMLLVEMLERKPLALNVMKSAMFHKVGQMRWDSSVMG